MAGQMVNVNEVMSQQNFEQLVNDSHLVGGGISDIFALIRKLLSMNLVGDALKIVDMWTNDGKYTLAQFKEAIREVFAKLNVLPNDGAPVPPRLKALLHDMEDEEDAIATTAHKRPTREEVLRHLEAKGVKVGVIPPALLAVIIQLAMQFGLPLIEKLIDRIINRQAKLKDGEKLSVSDLF